jgi:hypothetical protein
VNITQTCFAYICIHTYSVCLIYDLSNYVVLQELSQGRGVCVNITQTCFAYFYFYAYVCILLHSSVTRVTSCAGAWCTTRHCGSRHLCFDARWRNFTMHMLLNLATYRKKWRFLKKTLSHCRRVSNRKASFEFWLQSPQNLLINSSTVWRDAFVKKSSKSS